MQLFSIFNIMATMVIMGTATTTSHINSSPVYIALPQHNIMALRDTLSDISDPFSKNYRNWLTIDEIKKKINPSLEVQNSVLDWINEYDIVNVRNNGDSITFIAPDTVIYDMFNVSKRNNPSNPSVAYIIPSHLKNSISFVEMNSYPIKIKSKKNIQGFETDDRYFARESLLRLYNVTNISLNNTVSGGLVEYQNNNGFTNNDLTRQQLANNQSVNNCAKSISNHGVDDESELDIQLMSQTADGIDLWYWNTPYWLYSFAVDFYNTEDIPDVISMSWGWAEDSQCDIIDCVNITSRDYVERVNNEYLKISLRGTTILASSGDAGAPGRTSEGCNPNRPINPLFPSSSPYVLSIGATFVPLDNSSVSYTSPICQNDNCITSLDERAISYEHVGWTAGGGFDIYNNETPSWQKQAVAHYLDTTTSLPNKTRFNINGRAYPDISAIGHSCPTYINGNIEKLDGTSCSAPVVAGLIAIINHHEWMRSRLRVGYLNPLLYYIHANCPDCFNDIVVGHNWCTEEECCDNPTQFGFQAGVGYDPVTGLGTLNVGNVLDFLDSLF